MRHPVRPFRLEIPAPLQGVVLGRQVVVVVTAVVAVVDLSL
jgi:hypothetical protein